MNEHFYYDGRQIKNYLVGFASIFSEIPYQNRKGKIESVPIHYGSPSDIISYLEMNVDNKDTQNRNRLKDVSVPMFSFRMTSMERNVERRRAPLDSITVDLRSLGYSTGYVAMKPAPFRFTFELLLWASSDYQAFEITEQIIPYFNSPQQVTIEPLPKCPVSTTEVHLESFEIDTEPDSQKYSALVTMTFNLTGWILSQPRIWSTNMKFELSTLDKENIDSGVNLDNTDYSVGHEIIDNNTRPNTKTKEEESLETIENFIRNTDLSKTYGEKLDWYEELVKSGRISANNGQILNTEPLTIDYKGQEKILYLETIELLIDDMSDINYLFTNEKLKESLKNHTIYDDIEVIDTLFSDNGDTIDIYLTLLDNNLVSTSFNRTDVPISNSDKLNMFGTPRVDIDLTLERMQKYLAGIENLKIKKDQIISMDNFYEDFSILIYDITTPIEYIPTEFTTVNGEKLDYMKTDEFEIMKQEFDSENSVIKLRLQKNNIEENLSQVTLIYYDNDIIKTKTEEISYNFDSTFDIEFKIEVDKALPFNIISDINNPGFNIKGIYIQDNSLINKDIINDLEYFVDLNKKLYLKDSEKQFYISEKLDNIYETYLKNNKRFYNKEDEIIPLDINDKIYKKIILDNNQNFVSSETYYVDINGQYITENNGNLQLNITKNRIYKIFIDKENNKFYSPQNNEKVYVSERVINSEISESLDKFNLFDPSIESNKDLIFHKNFFELSNPKQMLDRKFIDMDEFIVSILLYNKYKSVIDGYSSENNDLSKYIQLINDKYFKIFESKYSKNINDLIMLRNNFMKTISIVKENIDKLSPPKDSGLTQDEIKEGQVKIAPDLAIVLSNDKDGNPIYDINGDGYIDAEDLKLLGSNVDNPEDFDFEIKYGIWYKRFRPENMTEERIIRVSQDLKIIYYLTEKNDMSELKDYLILWKKGFLTDGFNIPDTEKIQKEIKALGYDIIDFDNKLLFFRLFVSSIRNIMITERDFIIYKVPDMNDDSKKMLYKTEGLNIDKIVMAKFLDRYFKLSIDEDESILDKKLFTELLPNSLGSYYTEAESFDLMWYDIKQTEFFKDSLISNTPWLDEQLPEVTLKINNL